MTKRFLLAAIGATMLGCGSMTTQPQEHCRSLDCLSQRAQQPIVRACVRDLEFYALNRGAQRAIDRKYRYPLTNARTYSTLTRMGAIAPSPRDWCEAYAAEQARVVMPQALAPDPLGN